MGTHVATKGGWAPASVDAQGLSALPRPRARTRWVQVLGLVETRRSEVPAGKFTLVFLATAPGEPELEVRRRGCTCEGHARPHSHAFRGASAHLELGRRGPGAHGVIAQLRAPRFCGGRHLPDLRRLRGSGRGNPAPAARRYGAACIGRPPGCAPDCVPGCARASPAPATHHARIAPPRRARAGKMAFVLTPDGISIELLQKGGSLLPREPWLSMTNTGEW